MVMGLLLMLIITKNQLGPYREDLRKLIVLPTTVTLIKGSNQHGKVTVVNKRVSCC